MTLRGLAPLAWSGLTLWACGCYCVQLQSAKFERVEYLGKTHALPRCIRVEPEPMRLRVFTASGDHASAILLPGPPVILWHYHRESLLVPEAGGTVWVQRDVGTSSSTYSVAMAPAGLSVVSNVLDLRQDGSTLLDGTQRLVAVRGQGFECVVSGYRIACKGTASATVYVMAGTGLTGSGCVTFIHLTEPSVLVASAAPVMDTQALHRWQWGPVTGLESSVPAARPITARYPAFDLEIQIEATGRAPSRPLEEEPEPLPGLAIVVSFHDKRS